MTSRGLAIAVLVLAPATVRADADPAAMFGFVSGHVGLGTPVGATGVELGLGSSWLRGSVGVGVGFLGIEKMANVRVVFPADRIHLGIGSGVSRGPAVNEVPFGSSDPNDPPGTVQYGDDTVWANLDLSLEIVIRKRMELRFYAGWSHPLQVDCDFEVAGRREPCGSDEIDRLVNFNPYFGAAVGWRFWN